MPLYVCGCVVYVCIFVCAWCVCVPVCVSVCVPVCVCVRVRFTLTLPNDAPLKPNAYTATQ